MVASTGNTQKLNNWDIDTCIFHLFKAVTPILFLVLPMAEAEGCMCRNSQGSRFSVNVFKSAIHAWERVQLGVYTNVVAFDTLAKWLTKAVEETAKQSWHAGFSSPLLIFYVSHLFVAGLFLSIADDCSRQLWRVIRNFLLALSRILHWAQTTAFEI